MAKFTRAEIARRWRIKHPDRAKESGRRASLKYHYGVSWQEYDNMMFLQNGTCAICLGDNVGKPLSVDHDHVTGVVRQLLCVKCNTALAMVNDCPELLLVAAGYLRKHGK